MTAVDQLSLWDLIEWRASLTPQALFAVDEDDRELSFQRYRDACLRAAAALQATGVGTDTPVAWMLPTRMEALVLAGGLARLGVVQIPLVPILRQREVGFILAQTGARHLVVPGMWRGFDYPAMAAVAVRDQRADVEVIVADPTCRPASRAGWSRGWRPRPTRSGGCSTRPEPRPTRKAPDTPMGRSAPSPTDSTPGSR